MHSEVTLLTQQDCQEFLAMLLDTLHEDHAPLSQLNALGQPNGECGVEGKVEAMEEDASSNQIAAAAHDSSEKETAHKMASIVSETFQGMLRSQVSSPNSVQGLRPGQLVNRCRTVHQL